MLVHWEKEQSSELEQRVLNGNKRNSIVQESRDEKGFELKTHRVK